MAQADENGRTLPQHNRRLIIHRNSFEYLVTSANGLGYCCVWQFLEKFKDKPTSMIADRLGCVTRTVRRKRKEWREGTLEKCAQCKAAQP